MFIRLPPHFLPCVTPYPLQHDAGERFTACRQVARLACGAAANAAEDSSTHPALLSRTNAMHYMVFLMRSRHLSVHREASRACGNLLTNRDAHKDFISEARVFVNPAGWTNDFNIRAWRRKRVED